MLSMESQEVIEGWRGVCVSVGLGKPSSRGVCAGVLAAGICYAASFPNSAFRRDGTMRPFKPLSVAPDATYRHFILTRLLVGTAIALFT